MEANKELGKLIDSYKTFNLKTPAEIGAAAEKMKGNFEIISRSGRTSADNLNRAFLDTVRTIVEAGGDLEKSWITQLINMANQTGKFKDEALQIIQELVRGGIVAFESLPEGVKKALDGAKDETSKIGGRIAEVWRRQVSTIVTDFSQGVADVILSGKKMKDVLLGIFRELGRVAIRTLIEALFNPLKDILKQVFISIGRFLAGLFDAIFGGLGRQLASGIAGVLGAAVAGSFRGFEAGTVAGTAVPAFTLRGIGGPGLLFGLGGLGAGLGGRLGGASGAILGGTIGGVGGLTLASGLAGAAGGKGFVAGAFGTLAGLFTNPFAAAAIGALILISFLVRSKPQFQRLAEEFGRDFGVSVGKEFARNLTDALKRAFKNAKEARVVAEFSPAALVEIAKSLSPEQLEQFFQRLALGPGGKFPELGKRFVEALKLGLATGDFSKLNETFLEFVNSLERAGKLIIKDRDALNEFLVPVDEAAKKFREELPAALGAVRDEIEALGDAAESVLEGIKKGLTIDAAAAASQFAVAAREKLAGIKQFIEQAKPFLPEGAAAGFDELAGKVEAAIGGLESLIEESGAAFILEVGQMIEAGQRLERDTLERLGNMALGAKAFASEAAQLYVSYVNQALASNQLLEHETLATYSRILQGTSDFAQAANEEFFAFVERAISTGEALPPNFLRALQEMAVANNEFSITAQAVLDRYFEAFIRANTQIVESTNVMGEKVKTEVLKVTDANVAAFIAVAMSASEFSDRAKVAVTEFVIAALEQNRLLSAGVIQGFTEMIAGADDFSISTRAKLVDMFQKGLESGQQFGASTLRIVEQIAMGTSESAERARVAYVQFAEGAIDAGRNLSDFTLLTLAQIAQMADSQIAGAAGDAFFRFVENALTNNRELSTEVIAALEQMAAGTGDFAERAARFLEQYRQRFGDTAADTQKKMQEAMETIGSLLQELIAKITELIDALKHSLASVPREAAQAGSAIRQEIDRIREEASDPILVPVRFQLEEVPGIPDFGPRPRPFEPDFEPVFGPFMGPRPGSIFGRRQFGGPVFPGLAYEVGERSSEIFIPAVAGRVEPKGPPAAASTIEINVSIDALDGQSVERVTREKVIPAIVDALRNNTSNAKVKVRSALGV